MTIDLEVIKELARNDALMTEREVQEIAYPHAPGTAKRPPSYVMVVAHAASVKVVEKGYRHVDEDALPT